MGLDSSLPGGRSKESGSRGIVGITIKQRGELNDLIRGAHNDFIKPRLNSSAKRLEGMNKTLEEDLKTGAITREEYTHCTGKIKDLSRLQSKLQKLSPIAEKFL